MAEKMTMSDGDRETIQTARRGLTRMLEVHARLFIEADDPALKYGENEEQKRVCWTAKARGFLIRDVKRAAHMIKKTGGFELEFDDTAMDRGDALGAVIIMGVKGKT